MECESSKNSTRSTKKTDNRHRIWTLQEEESLINALKDIVQSGWKCENGFKTGYLLVLEKTMVKAFPGTDLRADPHINSKIHVWKKNYGSLSTMLSRSGFGWNDATKMITVESEQVWQEYVKTDANARTMRFKTFPFYDAWCEIFGKDRATGENAEDFNTADNDQLDINADKGNINAEDEGFGHEFAYNREENDFMSVYNTSSSAGTSKKSKSKKRKSVDSADDRIVGLMGTFCDQTNARLSDIAKRIGYEFDMSEKRTAVYDALGRLGELSMNQQIFVAKQLANNNKDLDLFFSLPDDAKIVMVRMMISGHI